MTGNDRQVSNKTVYCIYILKGIYVLLYSILCVLVGVEPSTVIYCWSLFSVCINHNTGRKLWIFIFWLLHKRNRLHLAGVQIDTQMTPEGGKNKKWLLRLRFLATFIVLSKHRGQTLRACASSRKCGKYKGKTVHKGCGREKTQIRKHLTIYSNTTRFFELIDAFVVLFTHFSKAI